MRFIADHLSFSEKAQLEAVIFLAGFHANRLASWVAWKLWMGNLKETVTNVY